MPVVGLGVDRVVFSRMTRVDPPRTDFELFPCNPENAGPRLVSLNSDQIACRLRKPSPFPLLGWYAHPIKANPKGERGSPEADELVGAAADRRPFLLATDTEFAAEDLGQSVASTDCVEDSESVANIALATRISAHDHRERAYSELLIGKVLEILQPQGGNHGKSPSWNTSCRGAGTPPWAAMWFWMDSSVVRSSEPRSASSMRACATRTNSSWRQSPRASR